MATRQTLEVERQCYQDLFEFAPNVYLLTNGYSSLSRFHHFPISVLKIDRSFVTRMGLHEGNLEIVETIVTLAQKLGVDVTAEGVEIAEQLAQPRELKGEYG